MRAARRPADRPPRLGPRGPPQLHAAPVPHRARRLTPATTPEPPPTPEARAPRWGLGDAIAGLGLGLVASAVLATIWLGAHGGTSVSPGGEALAEVGLWLGFIGVPLVAARVKGSGEAGTDFGLRVRRRDLLVGPVVGVVSWYVLTYLTALVLLRFVSQRQLDREVHRLTDPVHGLGFVVLWLGVVVGAPFAEELFFRGLLLRSLQRRWGDKWAIGLSAVVFGLVHGEALQLAPLVALGVVLAVLALRTGRLGPGMLAHGAFNAVTMLSITLRRLHL